MLKPLKQSACAPQMQDSPWIASANPSADLPRIIRGFWDSGRCRIPLQVLDPLNLLMNGFRWILPQASAQLPHCVRGAGKMIHESENENYFSHFSAFALWLCRIFFESIILYSHIAKIKIDQNCKTHPQIFDIWCKNVRWKCRNLKFFFLPVSLFAKWS